MNKNDAIKSFNSYISFRTQAKEELAEIEKITNPQEQHQKGNSSFEKHSRNLLNAQGLLNSYNISGEVNMSDFWDYSGIVNELKEIKNKYEEENNKNASVTNGNNYGCGWCKKSSTGQYWHNEVVGEKGKLKPVSKVKGFYSKFCSQQCLNQWNQKNLKEQSNTEIICHQCNKFFSGQYWYKNNPRESLIHKFCSENCCNTYWNKKTCSGSDCSNLLTSEEICYCSTCLKKHDEVLKNLEKNQQDINKDLDNFNQGLNDYVNKQKDNANNGDSNISNNVVDIREREREREREQNHTEQQQLRSQISQLDSLPTKTPQQQQELDAKKNKLKELEEKEKNLTKSLPIETQITILEKEIKDLESKPTKTQAEEALLVDKKEQLEKLLKKQSNTINNVKPSDKTALYIGLGIVGVVLIGLVVILVKKSKKKNKY